MTEGTSSITKLPRVEPEVIIWTPLHLELMLFYHGEFDWAFPRENSVIVEYRKRLIADALLVADEKSHSGFALTEKGYAFVEMLCRTPMPVPVFVDPRTHK